MTFFVFESFFFNESNELKSQSLFIKALYKYKVGETFGL